MMIFVTLVFPGMAKGRVKINPKGSAKGRVICFFSAAGVSERVAKKKDKSPFRTSQQRNE
jgi:hypothetical protein